MKKKRLFILTNADGIKTEFIIVCAKSEDLTKNTKLKMSTIIKNIKLSIKNQKVKKSVFSLKKKALMVAMYFNSFKC